MKTETVVALIELGGTGKVHDETLSKKIPGVYVKYSEGTIEPC
jgi:hypothetical protein